MYLILSFLLSAHGQIRIVNPESLAEQFPPKGAIIGSTATFGAPYYGERVLGRMIYDEPADDNHPHCEKEGYKNWLNLQTQLNKTREDFENHEKIFKQEDLKRIFVVNRGGCSFVRKVLTAEQEFNAHAVIIVDRKDSSLRTETIQSIIMADDGFGGNIRIPSILVSHQDGMQLINAYKNKKNAGDLDIMLELEWDVPSNDVVIMDMWMSSASTQSYQFLKDFKPIGENLFFHLQFIPHYDIYDMDNPNDYNKFCYVPVKSPSSRYCADDPDMHGPITGEDVVEEDLRQICLWTTTLETVHSEEGEQNKEIAKGDVFIPKEENPLQDVQMLNKSKQFWEYVTKHLDRCPINGASDLPEDSRFGSKECSEKLIKEIDPSIEIEKINACMTDLGPDLLEMHMMNVAWAPLAIRINGWRYAGNLEKDLVAKALCSGYTVQPPECEIILKGEDALIGLINSGDWNWSQIILGGLIIIASIALIVTLIMRKCFRRTFRRALQEEVMLEVQSAMADYKMMAGEEGEDPKNARSLGRLPRWSA